MIKLGLQRTQQLLKETDLPWRAIHVAGTNGKGSVCTYISEMINVYNRSEYRDSTGKPAISHGRFTSPHFVDRWDGISLSRDHKMQTVPQSLFRDVEREMIARNESQQIEASKFELLTATAFEIFTKSKLDVAVVETGMGGRLDSTNIIGAPEDVPTELANTATYRPLPLVTAITKIGMDHQAYLGDTITQIAGEKAGIMKNGVPVVIDKSNSPEVLETLQQHAAQKNCDAKFVGDGSGEHPTHLHQNTEVAFHATLTALNRLGRFCGSQDQDHLLQQLIDDMRSATETISFRGRLEYLDIEPLTGASQTVLLDGAHNAQSAEVLGQEVSKLRQSSNFKNITWVLGVTQGKDLDSMLQHMLQPGDSVFAVEFGPVEDMDWIKPMPASSIISTIGPGHQDRVLDASSQDLLCGIQKAAEHSRQTGNKMVIAGSLYLAADVHRLLRGPA